MYPINVYYMFPYDIRCVVLNKYYVYIFLPFLVIFFIVYSVYLFYVLHVNFR